MSFSSKEYITTPTWVAMANPNIPVRSAGSTNAFHFLLEAMAEAVVGPPTLALDASTISRRGIPSALQLMKVNAKCAAI